MFSDLLTFCVLIRPQVSYPDVNCNNIALKRASFCHTLLSGYKLFNWTRGSSDWKNCLYQCMADMSF